MKFGFFCFDNAGGDAMSILADAAYRAGHEAMLFPKQTRGLAQRSESDLAGLDAMVTGLSSFETDQELAFAEICVGRGIPWYVFEDVPGACLRPKAKEWANRAKLVFLALPSGADAAREFGYPGSVYLGPPPQWWLEYERLMQVRADDDRSMIQKHASGGQLLVPLGPNDKVVGLIGGKDPEENNRVIKIVTTAIASMENIVLAFSQHPGEKPNPDKPEEVKRFRRLFEERRRMLAQITWANTSQWSGSQVAGAVDVMVYASGTNISIAGAYARVPGIYLDDEPVRKRLCVQSGQGKWFVTELGGACRVFGWNDLSWTLEVLFMDQKARQALYHQQEQAFPLPEDWHTETKIIRFLEQMA
ncbi:MAG: hypothetical protein HY452_01750 [Parcubacteria group bacterium]|nr:hypothetical protein [Parcubacteria group bacterium]